MRIREAQGRRIFVAQRTWSGGDGDWADFFVEREVGWWLGSTGVQAYSGCTRFLRLTIRHLFLCSYSDGTGVQRLYPFLKVTIKHLFLCGYSNGKGIQQLYPGTNWLVTHFD